MVERGALGRGPEVREVRAPVLQPAPLWVHHALAGRGIPGRHAEPLRPVGVRCVLHDSELGHLQAVVHARDFVKELAHLIFQPLDCALKAIETAEEFLEKSRIAWVQRPRAVRVRGWLGLSRRCVWVVCGRRERLTTVDI